jgi:hypothetical protein
VIQGGQRAQGLKASVIEMMLRFDMAKDATKMMVFLIARHPDAIAIQQNNT